MPERDNARNRELVDLPFYSLRNVSAPEDNKNGRRVLFGHAPATSVLDLSTNENVRDYILDAPGRQRRKPSQVHRAIEETLVNAPEDFSVLNGGICVVALDHEVDEKRKRVRLLKPSIINGSQTQGVLRDFYRKLERNGQEAPQVHVTFELIVTEDSDLIAETSIARNFQNDVGSISIAGRRGQLNELQDSLQREFPELKLQQSETQLSDDYLSTERLIQTLTALTPAHLLDATEGTSPNKTHAYARKTKCLKDFQRVHDAAKSSDAEDHERAKQLYKFYLDVVPTAHRLHEKWKSHPGFKGTRIRAIERGNGGEIREVPDGIVFPIIASLSAFAKKTRGEWMINPPDSFDDQELIQAAVTVYQEIADHNPQTMGKSRACYSQLYQLTSLYQKLTKD